MRRCTALLAMMAVVLFTAEAFGQGGWRSSRSSGSSGHSHGVRRATSSFPRQYGPTQHRHHGHGGHAHRHNHGHHHRGHHHGFHSHSGYGRFSYLSPSVYSSTYLFRPYAYNFVGTPGALQYFVTPQQPNSLGYTYTAPSYYPVPAVVAPGYGSPLYQPHAGFPNHAGILNDKLLENDLRWNQPLDLQPGEPRARRPVRVSSADDKIRSVRLQAAGDMWFRQQRFSDAYGRYEDAVIAAEDRPEARFRLAYALTAMGRYDLAVREFKRGLALDPAWPSHGISLDDLYGPDNAIAKSAVLHKVAEWVRADIRDPDRLFLLGILLHFDDDTEHAGEVFESALRLAGDGEHLKAFLRPPVEAVEAGPATEQAPVPDQADPGDIDLPDLPGRPSTEPARPAVPPLPEARPADTDSALRLPVP